MQFYGFDNLRIRQGILLDKGQQLTLELRSNEVQGDNGMVTVPMQLVDSNSDGNKQTIHASADIVLVMQLPDERPAAQTLAVDESQGGEAAPYYTNGQLFHGPQLQGLTSVVGHDEKGIVGLSISAPTPDQWMTNPLRHSWLADPQILDSSFQLMILWCFGHKQQGSLPSLAASYRQFSPSFPGPNTRIQCRITKSSEHSVQASIDFIDEDSQQLIARMEGYECTMTPTLEQAFRLNSLD